MLERELVCESGRCAARHRSVAARVQRGAAAQEPRPSNPGRVYEITAGSNPFNHPATHSLTGPALGRTSVRHEPVARRHVDRGRRPSRRILRSAAPHAIAQIPDRADAGGDRATDPATVAFVQDNAAAAVEIGHMRKIIVAAQVSIDGVMGGENAEFWKQLFAFHSADVQEYLDELLFAPDALLIGRK